MKKKILSFKAIQISVALDKGIRLPLSKDELILAAKETLLILKEKDAKVCLYFVGDAAMRKLNLKYRKINSPTDCLAFPMREGHDGDLNPELLGDVVISAETARKNAERFGFALKEEVLLYVIHGILHLLGYEDTVSSEKKKMRRMEKMILSRISRCCKPWIPDNLLM
ncbi:MAG: rRNA maturation RNase YbeY [Candidatus Omnitrophota bacterium]